MTFARLRAATARAAGVVLHGLGGICDDGDRFAAYLYRALWVECPCCLFFRGVALGFLIGAAAVVAVAALL